MRKIGSDPRYAELLLYLTFLNKSKLGETKQDFYCGITNDLERRRIEHNVTEYITTVTMDTADKAREVELLMSKKGFNTGSKTGNGTDDSIHVYLYRIVDGVTRQ